MTVTMRRAAVELEEDIFWCLVEWARRSRVGLGAKDALHLALSERHSIGDRWLAAMLLDPRTRDEYLDWAQIWTTDAEYHAWLERQPFDVLVGIPGNLRLAADYQRLQTSRSAQIRILKLVDEICPVVAAQLREAITERRPIGRDGAVWAPYF